MGKRLKHMDFKKFKKGSRTTLSPPLLHLMGQEILTTVFDNHSTEKSITFLFYFFQIYGFNIQSIQKAKILSKTKRNKNIMAEFIGMLANLFQNKITAPIHMICLNNLWLCPTYKATHVKGYTFKQIECFSNF